MSSPSRTRGLTCLTLAIAAVAFVSGCTQQGSGQGSLKSEAITLTASSAKAEYRSGEVIQLAFKLTNAGETETCVSNMVAGNIKFVSISRDGEDVKRRVAPVYYIVPLSMILEKSLSPLRLQESLNIPMASFLDDPGLEKRVLETVALDNSRGAATLYETETPGVYDLTIVYRYPGAPTPDCPNVFDDETNPARITFKITP